MTHPLFAPAAQPGYVQVPGGYPGAQQQIPQGSQLPPGLQPVMVPQQVLPPQMQQMPFQQQVNPLQEPASPLSMIPPRIAGREMQIPLQQVDPRFQQQQVPVQQQVQIDPRFQQQAPAQQGIDPNARIQDPRLPQYLQGKSLTEVAQMFEGMRQLHFQNQQQSHQQQPAQPVQGQPQTGQPQAPGQQQAGWDWRNPRASMQQVVQEELKNTLVPLLRPALENAMVSSAANARDMAAQELGPQRFAQLEPAIRQFLMNAEPQALTNKDTWLAAARYVVGEQALRPQQQMQPAVMNGQFGAFPAQQVGPVVNPLPNLNGFFTEQPNQAGQGPQGLQLSQMEMSAASAMGISPAEYAAFKQGIRFEGRR